MPETIEMLCDKLGVVVDELIPEIVFMHICACITWLIIGLVMLLIFILYHFLITPRIGKSERLDAYDKSFMTGLGYVITGIIATIGFIVIVANVCSLVTWNAAPKASALQYIVSWVG